MIVVSEENFLKTYKFKKVGLKMLEKYRTWFPVRSSTTLAKITANLITDGCLAVKTNRLGTKDYSYFGVFSNDKNELNNFSNEVESLFRIKGRITNWGVRDFGFSLGCIFINATLCRVLKLCGVPEGNKTVQIFDIPLWIKNSGVEIKKAFIQRCFDCDGSIRYDKNQDRWKISFFVVKSENALEGAYLFLSSLKNILKELNIRTTNIAKCKKIENIRKDGKTTWKLWIDISSKDIFNFCKTIGSSNLNKIEKINCIMGEKLDGMETLTSSLAWLEQPKL